MEMEKVSCLLGKPADDEVMGKDKKPYRNILDDM
jgi:hypothetical protein